MKDRERHLELILDKIFEIMHNNPDCIVVKNRFSREYWTPHDTLIFAVYVDKDGRITDYTNQTKRNRLR